MLRRDRTKLEITSPSRRRCSFAFLSQVIMTTANALTPKEVAALMVIGDKILSGRTKDSNAKGLRRRACAYLRPS